MDDDVIAAFAEGQDEEPKVKESVEVVSQRLKDLVVYVKGSLPNLFGSGGAKDLNRREFFEVLNELDEEFGYSFIHRTMLCSIITAHISAVILPLTYSVAASEMNRANLTPEEIEELLEDSEDGSIGGEIEVIWNSVIPPFAGDVGTLEDLASLTTTAYLNAVMWESPAWESQLDLLLEIMPDQFELYMGMVGLLLLYLYVKIMEEQVYPKMRFHPHI